MVIIPRPGPPPEQVLRDPLEAATSCLGTLGAQSRKTKSLPCSSQSEGSRAPSQGAQAKFWLLSKICSRCSETLVASWFPFVPVLFSKTLRDFATDQDGYLGIVVLVNLGLMAAVAQITGHEADATLPTAEYKKENLQDVLKHMHFLVLDF